MLMKLPPLPPKPPMWDEVAQKPQIAKDVDNVIEEGLNNMDSLLKDGQDKTAEIFKAPRDLVDGFFGDFHHKIKRVQGGQDKAMWIIREFLHGLTTDIIATAFKITPIGYQKEKVIKQECPTCETRELRERLVKELFEIALDAGNMIWPGAEANDTNERAKEHVGDFAKDFTGIDLFYDWKKKRR